MTGIDERRRKNNAVLRPLASMISRPGRLQYFEESLDANEFEIALHTLCEYLLEPDTPALNSERIDQIEAAHLLMEIRDDCVHRLRAKAGL